MKYGVVSTDDHLQEGPETWTARMSKREWGDLIPQVKRDDDGEDSWHIYGRPRPGGYSGKLGVVSGALEDRAQFAPRVWADMPVSSYVPAERVKAMDRDRVDVHAFFGNVSGVAGNTFQDPGYPADFRLACLRAYNDFQIEEYAEPYPGRFITLAALPLWDPAEAVAEVERTAKRGIKGITFVFPHQFGYPHIVDPCWDPLWAAAQDAGLSINFHIGTGGSMGLDKSALWEGQSDMFRLAALSTWSISSNTQVMSILLFSGILERFPALRFVASESGLGWAPYLLEVADHQWERQKLSREGMPLRPSAYFRRQCYVNFWFEVFGLKTRDEIGIDNIMWESDFPHPTCTWPNSHYYIERAMGDWPEEERRKVLVENAAKVFNLAV